MQEGTMNSSGNSFTIFNLIHNRREGPVIETHAGSKSDQGHSDEQMGPLPAGNGKVRQRADAHRT